MTMTILGLSCLGSFGHGQDALAAAFDGSPSAPFTEKTDTSGLAEFYAARALRQCDHFSRLALLAAGRAAQNANIDFSGRDGSAVILASGYGPAMPTFDFLDSILDHGEAMSSPLAFSLSVHNIPAAVTAKTMGIVGPCATVCQYESSVASGLMLARNWLEEGRADTILFGAVDETTAILQGVTSRLSGEREDNAAPARRRACPLGEAAAFFVLTRGNGPGIAVIRDVRVQAASGDAASAWLQNAAPASGPVFLSGAYAPALREALGAHDGIAAYGNVPVAPALDCVLGLNLLARNGGDAATCLNRGSGTVSAVTLSGPSATATGASRPDPVGTDA